MKRAVLVAALFLIVLVAAACQSSETPPAATPCGVDTAVTLTLLDETNSQLNGVQVSYRVNGGAWVEYPERVNGRVTLADTPGTYQIRAQKPGYQTTESIVPLAAFSCNSEPVMTTIILLDAQCPVDPNPLLIQRPSPDAAELTVTAADGREHTLLCQEQNDDGCQTYALPLTAEDTGDIRLLVADLPGLGEMEVGEGVVTYETIPFDLTLAQGNRQQTFDLAAVETGLFTLFVERDEAGCPLVDLTAVTLATNSAMPNPSIDLATDLLIIDPIADECQVTPVLTNIPHLVELPPGTHLADVQVIYWRDEEWVTAVCGLEEGQYLCTVQLPNPLIGQSYSVRLVVKGEEYMGTQLPFDNLCMIFGE